MGGVCSVVEAVMAVGFIAQGVSEVVLKEKIKKILKDHEDEFQIMNDLYGFVDKILSQKNLVSQLNANILFATDNWNTIFDDLQDKNELFVKLLANFPDVKASNFNYTFTSGLIFGVTVLAFAYIAYDFISGKAQVQIKSDALNFKEFCKTTSAKIKSMAPEIRGSQVKTTGEIEMKTFSSNTQSVPQSFRQSTVENVKAQEKSGGTSKVITGIRLIFIAVSIYGFVQGAIGLSQLSDQLKKYQTYFKSNGEFQQAEQGVLQLMNFVAVDIFNLANCSRAAIYDSKNMFLVKSITLPRYHEKTLDYANQLNADKFGLTDAFIEKSKTLLDSCNTAAASGKTIENKLKDLKTAFQTFFDQMKPEEVFLEVSTELSSIVGKYSLIDSSINEDQHNVNRFLTKVSQIFQDERDSKWSTLTPDQKKSIDSGILTQTLDKYKQIFQLDSLTLQTLDKQTKDIIFQSIVSFTTQFYADDLTGKSLFGLNILTTRSKTSYAQLLDSVDSKANVIPVKKEDDDQEKKEIEDWLKIGKKLNQKAKYKYWKKTDTPKSVFRYIRLEVEKYTSKTTGAELGTLLSYEGIHVKVGTKYFNVEKNTLKNTVTLVEA